eukprot:m.3993 g.3993  ORF g.3993 m.3993 type:complete len:214 (-) comp2872_c0_seq1:245-886(-)
MMPKSGQGVECEHKKVQDSGFSPLHLAAVNGDVVEVNKILQEGDEDQKKKLLEARTAVWQCTPLHSAAKAGQVDAVKALCGSGALIDATAKGGFTALHDCGAHGQAKTAEILLQYEADVHARTSNGRTPLHYAAGYGHIEVVKVLLSHKASPAIQDTSKRKRSPIDMAREYKQEEVLMILNSETEDPKVPAKLGGRKHLLDEEVYHGSKRGKR